MYDVVIIGSGVAGVSAALTLQLYRKNILWLGSRALSEKIRKAEKIKNYPALTAVTGEAFVQSLQEQISAERLSITPQTATGVYAMGKSFTVTTEKDAFEGKTVILATGVESSKSVVGEQEFLGRGVSYCATCDGFLYKDKTIAVVCTLKDKEHEVQYLASLAKKVYLVPLYKNVSLQQDNVESVKGMPVTIEGNKRVERLVFKDKTLEVDGVFFLKNAIAPSALVGGLQTQDGHVVIERDTSTNIAGLFAAGDCTGRPYQYAKAVGEGNVAAHAVIEYLNKNIKEE
ncbi:MAG: NAD(P)/FAD-dependent oxidoreductase [Clostridia bacterium]|nr:NAD(P)/FAD-dependent oxidoreductase [Clostridia bacterium]